MVDERTMAGINLHAVLRNLEDLCALDAQAHDIIAHERVKVRFDVPGVRTGRLSFVDGVVTADSVPAAKGADVPEIRLAFAGARHFNAMIGGKGMPIPLRGLRHLGFLQGGFTRLAERLEHVLRPDAATQADPEAARTTTILTAYTAFFALAEIGNLDPVGRLNAARIHDGTIKIEIIGGPTVSLLAHSGHLTAVKGELPGTRAWMTFDSLETAGGILAGTLDTYACIGDGRLAIKGFVPMVDNMNKLLTQVSFYLK